MRMQNIISIKTLLNEPSEHLRPKYIFERVETGVSLSWIQAWINDQCCQFVI